MECWLGLLVPRVLKPGMEEMKAGRMLKSPRSQLPCTPVPPHTPHSLPASRPVPISIYTCPAGAIALDIPPPGPGCWDSSLRGPWAGTRQVWKDRRQGDGGAGRGGRLRPTGCPYVPGLKPRTEAAPGEAGALGGKPRRSPRSCPNAAQRPGAPTAASPSAPQQGTRICIGIWFKFCKRTGHRAAPRDINPSCSVALPGGRIDEGSGIQPQTAPPVTLRPPPLLASRPRNLL